MLGRVLLGVAALVLALGTAELGLRLAGISHPVFETFDAERGFKLRPGKRGWYTGEGRAWLEINSLGYRDREHAVHKPADVVRVAFLGDSMTEARQVAAAETYWSRLGESLQTCPSLAGRRVEVMNFGIGGYNTAQALETFRKDVRRFAPDLVVLAFYPGNDVFENSRRLMASIPGWYIVGPVYDLRDGALVLDDGFRRIDWRVVLYEGIHHSRLLELVNQARRSWQQWRRGARAEARTVETEAAAAAAPTSVLTPPRDPVFAEAWTISELLVARTAAMVRQAGARFAVLSIPLPLQIRPETALLEQLAERLKVEDLLYPERRMQKLGARVGFPVIAPARPLQALAARSGAFMNGFDNTAPGTGHLNPFGHRSLAAVIRPQLCELLRR